MYLLFDEYLFKMYGILFAGSFMFFSFVLMNIIFTPLGEKEKKNISETDKFIESAKEKLTLTYQDNEYNKNIEIDFYTKENYEKIMEKRDNILETTWKRRILMEHTPQGNIIMFFDPYKFAFAYYSDNQISYRLLNAVAMKYVTTFFCRDFFIDRSVIPFGFSSPFLKIHEIDVSNKGNTKKIDVNKGPFARFKNYEKEKAAEKEKKEEKEENQPNEQAIKNYIKNKFLSLGKIYQFSPIQKKTPVKTQVNVLQSINYSSFKEWHNPSSQLFH